MTIDDTALIVQNLKYMIYICTKVWTRRVPSCGVGSVARWIESYVDSLLMLTFYLLILRESTKKHRLHIVVK